MPAIKHIDKPREQAARGEDESKWFELRTNAPTGRVDRNWTESGGKAP